MAEYASLLHTPLVGGVTPTASTIRDQGEFVAVAPSDHVLTEREWSILIGDNIAVWGKTRKRVSKYKLSEIRIFRSPFSEEVKELIAQGS